jgi:hypothetical protein
MQLFFFTPGYGTADAGPAGLFNRFTVKYESSPEFVQPCQYWHLVYSKKISILSVICVTPDEISMLVLRNNVTF